jgi:4-hydroxybenzoate polyprenyltransferase
MNVPGTFCRKFASASRAAVSAGKLAAALVVLLLAMLPLPLIHPGYGWPYALPAALLAGPALVACTVNLARPEANYARARSQLKWIMLAGMLSLLAGALAR